MSEYPKIIAVDFDGCLCVKKWPDIGAPNWDAINELIRRKADGDKVILWTCRTGQQLEDAILWCLNHGLKFDAINDNPLAGQIIYLNNQEEAKENLFDRIKERLRRWKQGKQHS